MKKLIFILLLLSFAFSQETLISGLISWYSLNEGSGNAIDAHGNNDGIVTGATHGATGILDDAYSFDGDDYVRIAEDDFEFDYDDAFSISAWVKTSVQSVSIVNKLDQNPPFIGWDMTIPTTNKLALFLITIYSPDMIWVEGGTNVRDNVLNHLVATYSGNGDASGVSLYVNGSGETENIVYNTLEGGESMLNNEPVQIGERGSGGEGMIGIIDDVGIWNRELTSDEVGYLYNSGVGLAYPFNVEENSIFFGINF